MEKLMNVDIHILMVFKERLPEGWMLISLLVTNI